MENKTAEEKKISFKVNNNKFWILEQKIDEEEASKLAEEEKASKPKKGEQGSKAEKPKPEDEKKKVDAWVFNNELEAIQTLREQIASEKADFTKHEVFEKIGKKYNLQEVEITPEKYNIKGISWMKVAMLGFAGT